MRNRLDKQIDKLNRQIIDMGLLCEEAIDKVVIAFVNHDYFLAKQVCDQGIRIDHMERDIESDCLKVLLHQQPVASDLRFVTSALKMITDMERIGDQCEDIASILLKMNIHSFDTMKLIEDMGNIVKEMIKESIEAFVTKDVSTAKSVIIKDDRVDELFIRVKNDIIQKIANNPEEGELVLDYLLIAKYFERMGDHATNISEWVIYTVNATHKSDRNDL